MEWINKLIPFVTLALGWALAQFGKYSADKKEDKKKLKKLLFNLLELRHLVKKEVEFESSLERLLEAFKKVNFAKLEIDVDIHKDIEELKPHLRGKVFSVLKESFLKPERLEYLESNIDEIVIEVAEIDPLFAHELSGKYRIRERLKKLNNYFDKIQEYSEVMPFDVKEWITPRITTNLLIDLDSNIKRISKTIGRSTYKVINNQLKEPEEENNIKEMEEFFKAYYSKIEEGLQST